MKLSKYMTCLAFGISSAFAGTMGSATYDYDGLSLGVAGGGLSLYNTSDFTTASATAAGAASTLAFSNHSTISSIAVAGNVAYGGMVGMVDPKLYLGGKFSVVYSPIRTTIINSFSDNIPLATGHDAYHNESSLVNTSLQPIYNLNAVLGYEYWPHILPYLEGGLSWVNQRAGGVSSSLYVDNYATVFDRYATGYTFNNNNYKTGYNLGLGLNYQPFPNLIITSEMDYIYFGVNNYSNTATIPFGIGTRVNTAKITNQAATFLIGASYLFGQV